jgi:MFS family permease
VTGEGHGLRSLTEARALFTAGIISNLGDALAAVAASLLVSSRTGSPALTALTLAAAYLPGLVGGLGLSGLADRFPRRGLCVVIDLARAPLVMLMVIPGMPAVGIIALIALIELFGQPFQAARAGLLQQVVPTDRLTRFIGFDRSAVLFCQFFGFVGGAAAVGAVGAESALVLDAASFAASALVILLLVRPRPRSAGAETVRLFGGAAEGWRVIRSHPLALRAVLVTWVTVATVFVAEGLAVPLARVYSGAGAEDQATTNLVILLLGSLTGVAALGSLAGSLLPPSSQRTLLVPLALLSTVPGMLLVTRPTRGVAIAIFAAAGVGSITSVFGRILFSIAIPDEVFGRAIGLAGGGVTAVQGLALLGAAGLSELMDVQDVIALACAVGTGLLIIVAVITRLPRGKHSRTVP